jgi:hypothetical protein
MQTMTDRINCVICERPCEGLGNNAMPVADGRCCNRCDDLIVTPARMSVKTGKPPSDFFDSAKAMHNKVAQFKKRVMENKP